MGNGLQFSSLRSRREASGPPLGALVILVLLVGALGAGWWFWQRSGEAEGPPEQASGPTGEGAMAGGLGPDDPLVLPPLGASDAFIREVTSRLSAHPRLAAWLVTDDLVRRFVEAVVAVARGSSPVPALEVMIPEQPFTVEQTGGRLWIHPDSYRRYDLFAEALVSIDTDTAVRLYAVFLPLFEEAYREIAVADETWPEMVALATRNLLAVRLPTGQLEVLERVDRYVFADARIESLTPAEKHVYRLGPGNAARVQAKLHELQGALELR